MASGTLEKPDDKAEALQLMERGRAEISAEMRWLRNRVNPKEALRRGFEHHPVAVIASGLALGLAAAALVWRKSHHKEDRHSSHSRAPQHYYPPPKQRSGLVGLLVGQVAHLLVPALVLPALEKFVKERLRHVTSTSFRP